MNNFLRLKMSAAASPSDESRIRANALFIYSKLVAGGMDVELARNTVEEFYRDGFVQGRAHNQIGAD